MNPDAVSISPSEAIINIGGAIIEKVGGAIIQSKCHNKKLGSGDNIGGRNNWDSKDLS